MRHVTETIKYIGCDDADIRLFESQYNVPEGMCYNSFVILDEKVAIMDTSDKRTLEQWKKNLTEALGDRKPDYLIVQHLEPDHASGIGDVLAMYPDIQVVCSAKAKTMIPLYFPDSDLADRVIAVKEGDTLELGEHTLTFVMAPMVHWPEVMVTYDAKDKVLFSADGFGKFGIMDADADDWACEARRYYFGIVGKYGAQVQAVLKKAAALDISVICPLHGPVLSEDLPYYLGLYNTWSSYGVESEGVFIAYTSVYGNTKKAAELLAQKLNEKGCPKTVIADLAREDMAESVEDAFRYGKIVLATTTYNADIFPFMKQFICELTERNYQNRTIGIIENGSWASTAAKVIKGMFEKSKNITFAENVVSIKSAVKQDNIAQIEALADELVR